jgi:hypothetical protein
MMVLLRENIISRFKDTLPLWSYIEEIRRTMKCLENGVVFYCILSYLIFSTITFSE